MILVKKKARWDWVGYFDGGEVKDTCWQVHFFSKCCPDSN